MLDVSQYAVGWGTLTLINAGIAQGKNRSGFNWFLLTLILGPLATFFLVISDKKGKYQLIYCNGILGITALMRNILILRRFCRIRRSKY